ncbi:MAG: hypothetical protein EOR00_09215 [Mesorhizobium sp.]|uniref:hypothetical protein n=1 Tax=Mesorhizobium sp. TaxID=1871066 RepID=UPI000FE7EC2E|nr:hypothetical protein [Mesorhizobium sp.]RWP19276.1 MAG: hypothetical protein EOR00_09215 [Mesorhizobium sp.]
MSNRDRFADAALGVVVGLGIALLFLVWANPEFRDPFNIQKRQERTADATANDNPAQTSRFWDTYATPTDTYAQWIAGIAAIASVGVSFWAVRLVRDTLRANTEAVSQARAANQIAQETAERQLRAYVLPANCNMEFADNGEPIAHVRIQNFGQTPAFDVKTWIHIWVEAFPKAVEFPTPPDDFQTAQGILGPGFHGTFRHRRELPIGLWELKQIQQKKAAIYVYGLIEYRDCFGQKRQSKFMRFFYGKYDSAIGENMHNYMEGNDSN